MNKKKWIFNIILFLLLVIGITVLLYLLLNNKEKLSLPKHLITVPLKRKHTEKILAKCATQILGTKETPIYIIENFMSPEECDGIIKSK